MSLIRLLFALGLVVPAVALAAAPNATTATGPDSTNIPFVTRISTLPENPNPFEPTFLVLEGQYPNLCGEILEPGVKGIAVFINGRTDCRDPLYEGWRKQFDLGTLGAGWHQVNFTVFVQFPGAVDPDVYQGTHTFYVTLDTLHRPLPFVDEIRLLNGRTGQPGALCSTDSILVHARGTFPNSCYGLQAIELLPSPILGGPLPQPPVVRYVIEHCPNDPCGTVMVPWDAYVMLPPLPASDYYPLFAQVAQVACGDTLHPDSSVATTLLPFRVDRCDSTPWSRACAETGITQEAPATRSFSRVRRKSRSPFRPARTSRDCRARSPCIRPGCASPVSRQLGMRKACTSPGDRRPTA